MIAAADTFAVEVRTYLRPPLPHPFLHCLPRPRPRTPEGHLAAARKTALSVERALAVEGSSAAVAAGVPSFASAFAAGAGPFASAVGAEPSAFAAGAVQFASAAVAAGSFASAVVEAGSFASAVEAGRVAAASFVAAAVAAASETAETSPADGTPPVRRPKNALVGKDRLRSEAHGNPYKNNGKTHETITTLASQTPDTLTLLDRLRKISSLDTLKNVHSTRHNRKRGVYS